MTRKKNANAFRPNPNREAWSASAVAAANPDGYWREINWHSAIFLQLHEPTGLETFSNSSKLEAIISIEDWRAANPERNATSTEDWSRVLTSATELLCKRIKTLEQRQDLGYYRAFANPLGDALTREISWLGTKLGSNWAFNPKPALSIGSPRRFEHPPKRVMGVAELSATLSNQPESPNPHQAFADAKTAIQTIFGPYAIVRIVPAKEKEWIPTQNEWHALLVARQISMGIDDSSTHASSNEIAAVKKTRSL